MAWLLGAHGFQVLAKSGVGTPEAAGRVVSVGGELSPVAVALAPGVGTVRRARGGALAGGRAARRAALGGRRAQPATRATCTPPASSSGWPALGVEIDERTLPQEVRYDEIGGVSYTKGCYTGQETVARLHFRGHTNRELRGLRWTRHRAARRPGGRPRARRRSAACARRSRSRTGVLGLGVLRREVEPGETVMAGGRRATVVALPFGADEVDG